jgi:hypothetical protein
VFETAVPRIDRGLTLFIPDPILEQREFVELRHVENG